MNLIRTGRLILRPTVVADSDELFEARGDPDVMQHWNWPPDTSPGKTRSVLQTFVREMSAGQAAYFTARRYDGVVIGIFDIGEISGPQADLGFMLKRSAWGHGYGYEGAKGMILEAKRRDVSRLKARIHVGNHASRRLLQKLGFRSDGPAEDVRVGPDRIVCCEDFWLHASQPAKAT